MLVLTARSLWGGVFLIEFEFGSVGFSGGEKKNGESRENPRCKDENQQQTQPT